MSEFITVAKAAELAPGQGMVVEVEGRAIALFNCNGEYFALDNVCPHRGGPLGEGYVDCHNLTVQCPWHGWTFGVQSGVSPVNALAKVEKFDVKVEGDEVKVSLD
ncbi:MAG TPA: Rieske (2Fe-2S) protein [Blastocatellia bacterium]|nr:Rieske (2Fe-2S) protein [Blastocatellia bacterium]